MNLKIFRIFLMIPVLVYEVFLIMTAFALLILGYYEKPLWVL